MSISADTFRKMEKIEATSEFECLDQLSRVQNDIEYIHQHVHFDSIEN